MIFEWRDEKIQMVCGWHHNDVDGSAFFGLPQG